MSLCGADDIECDGICCEGSDVCLDGACASGCGPDETVCRPDRACCGSEEACDLGQCVVPGGVCETVACATQQATAECEHGFVCDGDLGLCMPSFADVGCRCPPLAQQSLEDARRPDSPHHLPRGGEARSSGHEPRPSWASALRAPDHRSSHVISRSSGARRSRVVNPGAALPHSGRWAGRPRAARRAGAVRGGRAIAEPEEPKR